MKFEKKNLVIIDNVNFKDLIIPVGFFYNNKKSDDMNELLYKITNNNKTINDNLYDKLFDLANIKDNKKTIKKTKKNINNKNKKNLKKTKKNLKK